MKNLANFRNFSLFRGFRLASGDRRGNVALAFSLLALPLVATAGAGYDLVAIGTMKSRLQQAADAGALRAGRELRLAKMGNYDLTPIAQSAANNVLRQAPDILQSMAVAAKLVDNNSAVQVDVSAIYAPKVIRVFYRDTVKLAASAVARTNGFPICALGLEENSQGTVYLEANAKVTAQYCAVQSNSKHSQGLSGANNSVLTAGMICTAGGKFGSKANFTPDPLTDCPVVADPLAGRAPPPVGGCLRNDEVVDGGTMTLMPGVYCGGLKITGGANVTMAPGEYIVKDGPFEVDGRSTLRALGVGIYLTGANAIFKFADETSLRMTAPTGGPLAGMIFYEDRNAQSLQTHEILSNDATLLLGTIYLPKGRLRVQTNKSVGQQSAFTIIVARRMELYGGSDLVLNSDYLKTNIPVPGGLNPGYTYLSK